MKNKKYIGQLISIKFNDRETPIYGIVIDYNEDWTLMKYNPADFVLDGFIILRHKNIQGFHRGTEEKFIEKVIKLKKQFPIIPSNIPLIDLQTIISYVSENYGVFQLEKKSEMACYICKLKSFNNKQFYITSLNTQGKWSNIMRFRSSDIRIIVFDTDYINSLKLINNTSKKQ